MSNADNRDFDIKALDREISQIMDQQSRDKSESGRSTSDNWFAPRVKLSDARPVGRGYAMDIVKQPTSKTSLPISGYKTTKPVQSKEELTKDDDIMEASPTVVVSSGYGAGSFDNSTKYDAEALEGDFAEATKTKDVTNKQTTHIKQVGDNDQSVSTKENNEGNVNSATDTYSQSKADDLATSMPSSGALLANNLLDSSSDHVEQDDDRDTSMFDTKEYLAPLKASKSSNKKSYIGVTLFLLFLVVALCVAIYLLYFL